MRECKMVAYGMEATIENLEAEVERLKKELDAAYGTIRYLEDQIKGML